MNFFGQGRSGAMGAPTFCKCTCFKNSTLIQLGPSKSTSATDPTLLFSPRDSDVSSQQDAQNAPRSPPLPLEPGRRAASTSCTQCTRAFCLSQNLPICRDAGETDVVATCFQRDSRKDRIIVWGFILATAGLLGWAAVRRVVELREERKIAAAAGAGTAPGRRGRGRGRSTGHQDRGAYVQVPVRGEGTGGVR
ncbi:hypothetical protein DL766_004550 [Monosporascus sp. MC13-8B]|uniref:Uncharacterized protein n=1 Tax=Monosporascus cannonballus TaxID=155416 RepID=A0ABY0HIF3_9PEZI|nr:hypothetical protein DL763_005738 [Monosporascus cannonballus]RYO94168.1 hypothetical protein DL762_000678 [Monosporascus cannonballus]RYP31120.1 hypothetical protein DL766_004550 [Monosporascus sp. MC13-8B]